MDDITEYVKSRRQQQELDKQYIRSRRKALGYEGDPLVNYLRGEFGIKPKPLPTQTKEVTFTYPNAQGKTVSSTETVPDYPINPTAIPKFQRAGPETPPEPRDVFSEAGAAFLRNAVDLTRNTTAVGLGLFTGPDSAREILHDLPLPEGPQPTRTDTSGEIANQVGGFIPAVLGGPLAFAGQSYREVNDRRQGESTGAELGAAVIGGAFGVVPIGNLLGKVPGLKQVVQRIGLAKFGKGLTEDTFNLIESFGLSKAQKAIGEQAIKATTSGLANVGQAAGTEYLARASGAEPVDFKPVEQFLGGFLGHGVLASVKGVSGHFENKRYRDFIKEAVNRKVLSPEEVALFGDNNREAAVETVLRRVNNEEVELVPLVDESGKPILDESKKPRIGLKSKPDTVTWAEKVALEHNQDLIKTYRNALAKGGERIFIDTSRLPAREEQVTRVKTRLSELSDQVRSALGVKDITEYGTPVTERALFYRDARIILDRLNDNPSRLDYDRAVALLAYGRNASKSLEPIPEARSIAAKQTGEILSPIKLRPTRQIEFPLELVNEKGYLADAKTLSQKPKTQEKIAAAQRGLLARVAALKAAKGFSDPQRLTVLRTIETEFVAKIDDLRNNDNTSTKARARVNRAIQDSALSEPQKASISQKLEQQFKDIDQNLTETQLGVIDRLVELNKDSPDTLQILEGLRQRVLSDESFAPASERVRLAREKIQTLAGQHLEIENLREKIVDVVKDLPENLKGTLYETTISAKTPQELKAILATVDQATERFIVADNANKVKTLTGKPLELNPQRDAVLEYLKSLQKLPLAQPIESVGPVAIKFTDPQTGATIIGKGKEYESHADVATRAIASTKDSAKIKHIVDTLDNDKNFGYISSRGRFIGREEAAIISQKVRDVLEGKSSLAETGPHQTRVLSEVKKSFTNLKPDELKAWEAVVRARAERWVKEQPGRTLDDFWKTIEVRSGKGGKPALYQRTVWHGSGEKFDKFSTSKIDSGEGAQAYGWGLYFASKQKIAQWYQKRVSSRKDTAIYLNNVRVGEGYKQLTPTEKEYYYWFSLGKDFKRTPQEIEDYKKILQKDIAVLDTKIDDYTRSGSVNELRNLPVLRSIRERKQRLLDFANTNPVFEVVRPKGALYKVKIQPKDDELLLWDEPFSKQSEKVQAAILSLSNKLKDKSEGSFLFNPEEQDSGGTLYNKLSEALGKESKDSYNNDFFIPDQEEASKQLLSNGVRGVKYKDASSRYRLDKPSFNYVIFDDSDISIKQVFQKEGQRALASLSFEDGKSVIRALESPNVTSLFHETAHLFLPELSPADLKVVSEVYGVTPQLLARKEQTLTKAEQKSWVKAHERFARDFENYLSTGKSPSSALTKVFQQIQQWFVSIYQGIKGSPLERKLNPKIKDVFDRVLNNEQSSAGLPKPTEVEKPIVYFDENGKQKINQKNLQEFFNKLSSEQSTYVHDRVQSLIRQGQIERGLYQKYLKFSTADDQANLGKSLRALKDRKETGQDVRHLGALVADPVMYEAYLYGLSRSDPNNPLYKIYHGDLVPGMSRHNQNEANTQRFLSAATEKFLDIDSSSLSGQQKLGRYLSEEIAPGIQRDKAMSIYALATDEGRVNDLRKYGVVDHGKPIDIDTALASLSVEDRAFVNHVKGYFQNNAFVERAFSLFLLLNGYSPQRFKGFFPSSRSPEKTTLDPDFGTFATTLLNSIDPLKERLENVGKPYNIDKGFYSSFNQATHQLSLFAELGESLYRAQKAFVNEEFKDLFTKKQGRAKYESMNLYLSNIYGQVGHSRTVFDRAVDKTIQGFSVSRTALNVYSAAKQIMHIATIIADGSLSFSEVMKSIASGSWLKKSVGEEMQQNSGLAYQRYHGQFLREMMVAVDQGKTPSLLDVIQHKSMLFQRAVDRATMQITWDAARRTAYKNGYRGDALKAETVRLFEISAGRDQPTSNPLYASELEIHAKRQPLLRGSLLFMREQNRIYNVVRRHTLTALQNPTADNIHNALRAIVFGVIVNAAGIVGINALRRATFGKPQDERDFTMDALSNIIGMYYLAAPLEPLMEAFVKGTTTARSHASDNLISPIGSLVLDATKGAFAFGELAFGEGGEIKSGPQRGMSKEKRELVNLLDSSSSLVSGFFGLPLWSIWQQAKGLYNWTDDQVRLMTRVEHERQLLKQTDPGSTRLRVIESTMKKVNEIHRKREKGTLSPSQAQDQIEAELSQLVD